MPEFELVTQSRVSLFVAPRGGKQPEYVSDRLGIKRVMWRGGQGRQRVIFYCLAKADNSRNILCEEKKGLFGMEGAKPVKIKVSLKENENNS